MKTTPTPTDAGQRGAPQSPFRFLVHGIDTIQCAYYLHPRGVGQIDFTKLRVLREELRDSRDQEPRPIQIGTMEFLLEPHGSASGYPFILNNRDYRIECGEFNNPSFYVTFRSEALWREPAAQLRQRFLDWAEGLDFVPAKPETLSRVDVCFDYYLPELDFDEDAFVSLANKDSQHRENGAIQTFTFGRDAVVLRVYDKVTEIEQQSGKTWLFALWGEEKNVWRIEWQARKEVLRRFGIRTFGDLNGGAGDLLRYLAHEHTTLRVAGRDSNRSRWPLHPLWRDLHERIRLFNAQGVVRVIDPAMAIEERIVRLGISLNGNLKQLAALRCVQRGQDAMSQEEAQAELKALLRQIHNPLNWRLDVGKRIKFVQLGQ